MPVYLRGFYYRKLVDAKKKEKEEIDKSKRKAKIARPAIGGNSNRFNR